jgi:MFS family permease
MAIGCAILAVSAPPITGPVFMVCVGLSVGAYSVSASAIWPELYGTKHLGAIRGFAQSIMVVASGLSPVLFGMLVDRGITLATIAGGCAVYCLIASAVAAAANARDAVKP